MKFLFIFAFCGLTLGCVSRAVQTEAVLASPERHAPLAQVENVPFIDQSVGYCGPATLTMVMQWNGKPVTVDEVAAMTFTPGLKGSLQSDMISASRRLGFMAVPIKNLDALLKEVAAGHPVIVFENLSVSWLPTWHYAVVIGYDLNKKEIVLHSGQDANYHWDLEKFERSWMLGDYWGLVVLPAGQLAASADEFNNSSAAAGLEQTQKFHEAEISYRSILEKWPTSLIALTGLANINYQKQNYRLAQSLLKKALKHHPESQTAQHNLAVVESKLK